MKVPSEVRAVWNPGLPGMRERMHYPDSIADGRWGRKVLRELGEWSRGGNILEWGVGGGHIAKAFEGEGTMGVYVGVDISGRALLDTSAGLSRMGFVGVDAESFDKVPRRFDTIISVATFQHFHSEQYARHVLGEMREVANEGCRGLIQIRYTRSDGKPQTDPEAPYAESYIHAHAWELGDFWLALQAAGFVPETVRLEPYRPYAWFKFRG
jgi:ubiquinone/menaquinone biosynthesis C-methylase UbiE